MVVYIFMWAGRIYPEVSKVMYLSCENIESSKPTCYFESICVKYVSVRKHTIGYSQA